MLIPPRASANVLGTVNAIASAIVVSFIGLSFLFRYAITWDVSLVVQLKPSLSAMEAAKLEPRRTNASYFTSHTHLILGETALGRSFWFNSCAAVTCDSRPRDHRAAAKQLKRSDETVFLVSRRSPETKIRYQNSWSTNEGLVMWWGLVVSLVFLYPVVEMAEEWRLRRSADKDLAEMRRRAASGHRWDAARGQWVG